MSATQVRGGRSRRTLVLLSAIVVLGFLLRCSTIGDVFLDGSVVPFDPDSAYHLWRIEETVRTGSPPHFDRFANAPIGAEVTYRDGSAVLVAAPARLLLGKDASRFNIEVWSLFYMPVMGALSLLTVFAMARQAFGTAAGIAAAAFAAVLPEHFLAGLLGRVDHHVWEPALGPLALALLLATGPPPRDSRRRWLSVVLAGAVLALFAWTVMAAMLHAGVVGMALLVAALAASLQGDSAASSSLLRSTGAALALAALLMLPEALAYPRLAYDQRSALPAALFAAGALATTIFAWAAARGTRHLLGALSLSGVAAAVLAATVLRSAAAYTSGTGVLAYINETVPLWHDPIGALKIHSLALPLTPLLLLWLARAKATPAAWAVATFGILGFLLSCMQARWGFILVPALATALGAAITALWQTARPGRRAAIVAGTLLCMAPCLYYLARLRLLSVTALSTFEAADWLRRNTPAVGPRRGTDPPPYTTIATADDENFYAYLGERPVLATGLLDHADYKGGFVDTIALLFSEEEDDALMTRRRVRYLMLPALDEFGETIRRDLYDALVSQKPRLRPTIYARLFEKEGSAQILGDGNILPALGHFRLIHDSPLLVPRSDHVQHGAAPSPERQAPAIKIFERVPGAGLEGSCQTPKVQASIATQSDLGRRFKFTALVPCQQGHFALRIPYAGQAEVWRAAGAPEKIAIADEDVTQGRLIPLQ